MTFDEIDEVIGFTSELAAYRSSGLNRDRFYEIHAKLLKVSEELPNSSLTGSLRGINPNPTYPYYPEVAIAVRNESFREAVEKLENSAVELIAELRKTATIVSQDDLDAITSRGLENQFFEFKSTLRWDIGARKINCDLEFAILKTIAAFNNGYGGNLLIGVDDAGHVYGLECDYRSLDHGQGNRDEFERHLRTLIDNAFGIGFCLRNLKLEYPLISGKEICQVKVQRGTVPLFLEKKQKSGEKKEVFYFRSGNESKDIEKLSVFFDYARTRFL
jgi:hypothetical protein